jgi:Ca-activated chloride channel family protein
MPLWLLILPVPLLALLAEYLHARKTRRVATLSFGPTRRPAAWTRITPLLRAVALALLTWGLATLYVIDPKPRQAKSIADKDMKRLLLVLDVSPSMDITDAGPTLSQTRSKRAAELVQSILGRVILDQTRVTIVAVYNGALPVVIDTKDHAVIKNILNDLPLEHAFDFGKTKLLDGIREAFNIAKPWREKSTTLLVVSDGDTVPDAGMPDLPRSIAQTLVIGVGDSRGGKFIDGHTSRQDASTLHQLATRLRGVYHDGNEKHLPSETFTSLAEAVPMRADDKIGKREFALASVAFGGIMLTGVPVALALFGTNWKPGRRGLPPFPSTPRHTNNARNGKWWLSPSSQQSHAQLQPLTTDH